MDWGLNQNLPAYVVLDDPDGMPVNGIENWTSGFLPPIYQGTRFRSRGQPVLNLRPEKEDAPEAARAARDFGIWIGAILPDTRINPLWKAGLKATNWPVACSLQRATPWI